MALGLSPPHVFHFPPTILLQAVVKKSCGIIVISISVGLK